MLDVNKYKAMNAEGNKGGYNSDLREVFDKYMYHYKWFLLAIIVCLFVAYIYLRYTPNQYEVNSSILIDDKENGGSLNSELSAFKDLGILSDSKTTLDTEMSVLKSRALIQRSVKELGINVSFYTEGRVRSTQIYKEEVPFKISFLVKDSIINQLDTSFSISAISANNYVLYNAQGIKVSEQVFGEKVSTHFGDLIITPVAKDHDNINAKIHIHINPVKKVANYYRKVINIAPDTKKSSVLVLSLKDIHRIKAMDILNNLVSQYNKTAIDDQKKISKNTDDFINQRIEDISLELTSADLGIETYKTDNKLTDIGLEAGLVLESNSQIDKKIVDLTAQLKLIDYMQAHMKTNNTELIPSNLGLRDKTTSQATLNYNKLLLEKNRILGGSSELNPTVINLESQISSLRISIDQSLANLRSSLVFEINEARLQQNRLSSKRAVAPKQEREFQDIKRKQLIIETLYLYLLEKREENAISMAVTAPNAKIIDLADGDVFPVGPKKGIIFVGAALLGIIIPFVIIYIHSELDNKIHTIEEVEKELSAPILGDIPSSGKNNKIIIAEKDNDSLAESFRILRTNVGFMLSQNKEGGKCIFVTSTIGGEGKTFVALNLAHAMALINKKVLIIGADLRKPKIAKYLNIEPKMGLTDYLIDHDLRVSDILTNSPANKLEVITSGPIPPNPSELLTNTRFEEVLAYGKSNYDFVIVDTAPVNLVTDTLLLGKLADLFVYVIRADYLDKRLLSMPQKMFETKRLVNMAVLINDTNYKKKSYSYGYSNSYGEQQKKSIWQKLGLKKA